MDITRRDLLKQLGTLTAGAAVISLKQARAEAQHVPPRREGDATKRYGMLIDLRRCIGCQACTVSCTVENQMPAGQFRTTVRQYQVLVMKKTK